MLLLLVEDILGSHSFCQHANFFEMLTKVKLSLKNSLWCAYLGAGYPND